MLQPARPFTELFAACRTSAVHLEMRDSYDDPAETARLEAWRNGFRHDPADRDSWWRPWLDLVSQTVARGVEIRRARIISEPISQYTRFLYDITFTNVAAGEQVRWLARRRASDIALPGNDFWVFDGQLVRFGYFSGEGTYLGDELEDDPAIVKLCADAFEAVWERGIPHEQYQV